MNASYEMKLLKITMSSWIHKSGNCSWTGVKNVAYIDKCQEGWQQTQRCGQQESFLGTREVLWHTFRLCRSLVPETFFYNLSLEASLQPNIATAFPCSHYETVSRHFGQSLNSELTRCSRWGLPSVPVVRRIACLPLDGSTEDTGWLTEAGHLPRKGLSRH